MKTEYSVALTYLPGLKSRNVI